MQLGSATRRLCHLRDLLGAEGSRSFSVEVVPECGGVGFPLFRVVGTRACALDATESEKKDCFKRPSVEYFVVCFNARSGCVLLTCGFLGETLAALGVAPVLGVNFLSMAGELTGSFLGEILAFVGDAALLFSSSSLLFIKASLELVLAGAGLLLGDGLITSSVTLLLRLVLAGLLVLAASAGSEGLFIEEAACDDLSSLLLRA